MTVILTSAAKTLMRQSPLSSSHCRQGGGKWLLLSFPHSSATSRAAAAAAVVPLSDHFVVGSVRTNMYAPIGSSKQTGHPSELDPEVIFDEIDIHGNGVITKEEFVQALNRLNYYQLLQIHRAAHANMEEKLQKIASIERGMQELAEAHSKKQQAYSNVGMMTGAEIDALFEQSQSKKDTIHTLLGDLKALIAKTRASLSGNTNGNDEAYNNVGMTTASEIDSFFQDDATKKNKTNDDKKQASSSA